jgi:polyphosphate kinase
LYRNVLLPALARAGIRLLREDDLNKQQRAHLSTYFRERIARY